ncbi:MAG TPA: hypothetical protein VFH61_18040 [Thermoleophilia bacterium]|nr:hypothetical protein [Thermoleophilia bacterium]
MFFTAGGGVVVYGDEVVLPLLVIAGLLVVAPVVGAARRRLLSVRGLCLSLLAVFGVLVVALLVMAPVWGMYRTAYAQRTWSDLGMVISDFYLVGLVSLAVAAVVGAYMLCLSHRRGGRRRGRASAIHQHPLPPRLDGGDELADA